MFTPETERAEAEAEERKARELRGAGSVRGGVGAVVGFLTGLMSRTPSLARDSDAAIKADSSSDLRRIPPFQQEYSPPPSPLAHKQQLKSSKRTSISSHSHSPSATTPALTSSVESLARSSRGPSFNLGPAYSITSHNSTSDSTPRASRQVLSSLSHPHGTTRLRPPPSTPSKHKPQTYAQASKARAYLRHMASAPSIQPSSNITRPPPVRHSSSRYVGRGGSRFGYPRGTMVLDDSDVESEDAFMGRRGNGEGEDESDIHGRPPLPRTWLENVARAILFGGAGAHAGTPSPFSPSRSHPQSPRPRLETLQMSPALSSKSALSDQINVPQIVVRKDLAPPFLCAQVVARRTPSETRVSRTKVVCRSAPPSRSGSRVRGGKDMDVGVKSRAVGGTEDTVDGMFLGEKKHKLRKRDKKKGKIRGRDGVPSLARTQAQDDEWPSVRGDWEMVVSSSDDEDEGELNLARLLVPPKRQNSIRSLRRHLHGHIQPSATQGTSSSSTHSESRSATGNVRGRNGSRRAGWDHEHRDRDEDEDEDWRRGMLGSNLTTKHVRGIGEGVMSDESCHDAETTGSGTGTRRRRGIPGTWATES